MASLDSAELAATIRDQGPDAVYRLGVVSAANFTSRPPTLVVGEGDLAREMPFMGSIADYQTGQTVVWLSRPGAPLVIAPLPIRGIDQEDPDTFEAWQTPTLVNGWSNFGSGLAVAGYYKQNDGWVRLKGVVGGGTDFATIFTLPEGYRPPFEVYVSVLSASATARLRIRPDGTVSKPTGGAPSYLSLNGVTFPTTWNQSAWLLPRLSGGWRWSDSQPGSTVEFFLRDDGWVWVKGLIQDGSATTIWCTLPQEAYLRRGGLLFAAQNSNGFSAPARIDVQYTGDSVYQFGTGALATTVGGIHYFAGRSDSVVMWTTATLQNTWVAQPAGTLQPFPPGYYLDHHGVVHLRGVANNGFASSDTIFTLPAGYRPLERQAFLSIAESGSQGRVDVHPDGRVVRVLGSTGYLTLSGISFRAEA